MNELDWGSLGFRYRKTNAIVFSLYRDGQWSEPNLPTISISISTLSPGCFTMVIPALRGLRLSVAGTERSAFSGRTRTPDVSGAVPTVFRWPLLPRNCS